MAEVELFTPRWLYHPDFPARPAEYVDTQAQYDALMAQGVWMDSPAAFGVVTAPNREEMARMAPRVSAGSGDMTTGDALTLHLHTQLEALSARVEEQGSELDVLHGLVRQMRMDTDALTALVAKDDKATAQGKK